MSSPIYSELVDTPMASKLIKDEVLTSRLKGKAKGKEGSVFMTQN